MSHTNWCACPWVLFYRQMKTRPGEVLIDCLDSIEDTKGNNGDRGSSSSPPPSPPTTFVISTHAVQWLQFGLHPFLQPHRQMTHICNTELLFSCWLLLVIWQSNIPKCCCLSPFAHNGYDVRANRCQCIIICKLQVDFWWPTWESSGIRLLCQELTSVSRHGMEGPQLWLGHCLSL